MKTFVLGVLAIVLLAAGCSPSYYDRPIKEAHRTVTEVSLRLSEVTNDETYVRAELSLVNASPLSWDISVSCRWFTEAHPDKTVGSAKTSFTVPSWTIRRFGLAAYIPTRIRYGIGRDAYWMPTPLAFGLRMRCEMEKLRHVSI